MGDGNAAAQSRKRVFISYSHTPPENADFARSVAAYLRHAEFGVWLDEEEIPHGGDIEIHIRKAARESDVGLFIVTPRSLERQRSFIRHEVSLFDREGVRRLAILRYEVDEEELGPHFATVKTMQWLPDDPLPFARLWEIYCGIVDRRPGPKAGWDEEGRRIFGGGPEPSTPPAPPPLQPKVKPQPKASPSRMELSAAGRPLACVTAAGWTYLVSEQDEWAGIGDDGSPHPPVPILPGYTASIGNSNELLVATYDSTVARLAGQSWEMIALESPAMCFAASPGGTVVGTASGAVIPLADRFRKIPLFRMRDPVAALAAFDGGLLALGTRGMFGRVAWPVPGHEPLQWIETGDLGRPVGFFPAMEMNHVGVYSSTRLGVLVPETGNLVVCPKIVGEGIRSITFLGPLVWPYTVHTDAGNLFMVDAGLNDTRAVRFPRSVAVIGCAGASWTGISLAWTNEGRLYRVSVHGVPEPIADGDVVMAYCLPGTDSALVVRWTRGERTTIEKLRVN